MDQNSLQKTWTDPRSLTFNLILLVLTEANGGSGGGGVKWVGLEWGVGGGVEVGSPWQMSNFITEPHMNVAHTLPTALHAGIIWSFWETEVLDCNLWAVSFKSHPQLYWRRQLPELVCTFKGYMFRSLSHSLSGTKVKGSLTAWEKVEQCEITLIQRFLPHTSPMNP